MHPDDRSTHGAGLAHARPPIVATRSPAPDYRVTIDRDDELSLFAITAILLRNWRRILLGALVGALLALPFALMKPTLYAASFGFIPQSGEAVPSGLSSLAGQFGLSAPGGNPAQRPEFYLTLVPSRELLVPIVQDTLTVPEEGNRRMAVLDLLGVPEGAPHTRLDEGIDMMRLKIETMVIKNGGIVRVYVRTKWPSVSRRISERLLEGVNAFNLRQRQTQATEELRFVQGLLEAAQDSQRMAEDRIQRFLSGNRAGIATSPQLSSTLRRLERDADARTSYVTSLAQQRLDVSTRRSRDTPTITVFESPWVSSIPEPRRRVMTVLTGFFFGGMTAAIVALVAAMFARRRHLMEPHGTA